eukprot:jgi/Botrbrau1/16542/Bobra.0256s0001.1
MQIFVRTDRTTCIQTDPHENVEGLSRIIEAKTGTPSFLQRLIFGGQQLDIHALLSSYGISAGCTIHVALRVRGGAKTFSLTVKPRLHKDKWSVYWKEAMETKTDVLEEFQLKVSPATKISEIHEEVRKRFKWELPASLERLEGFKEPWDVAVYKGKAVSADITLKEAGVSADAPLITVRRLLIPEGKSIFDLLYIQHCATSQHQHASSTEGCNPCMYEQDHTRSV